MILIGYLRCISKRDAKLIHIIILNIIFKIQKILFLISYFFSFILISSRTKKYSWVIGVSECVGNIYQISKCLNNSVSVCINKNKFYDYDYDYTLIKTNFRLLNTFLSYLYGPIVFGYLVHVAEGFFYIWSDGFLISQIDGRHFEFSFLKKRNRKISCFFCGNDIRSLKLEMQLGNRINMDVAADYYEFCIPEMISGKYEKQKKVIASSADKFADFVFNADVDQSSYLSKPSLPYIYFYPDDMFCVNERKFDDARLKILHAPTSPIIKGTQLVRATIKQLKVDGFDFEYKELLNVPNKVVLQELRCSHIVLNEFYMFSPGLLGIESMANFCVLLTSADEHIETSLPLGSNNAWIVTHYYEIYQKLRWLLENRQEHVRIARAGYEWALANASFSASRVKLNNSLHT